MIRTVRKIKWSEVISEYQRANWMFKKDLSEEVIFKLRHEWQEQTKCGTFWGALTPGRGNSGTERGVSLVCYRTWEKAVCVECWNKQKTWGSELCRAKWKPWDWICVLPPCFKSLGKSLMDFVLYYLVLRVVESHWRVLSGTVTWSAL